MNPVEFKDFEYIYSRMDDYRYLDGKTILIAGATSFLFRYFAKSLVYYSEQKAKTKLRIIALVRNEEKAKKIYRDYPSVEIIKGDVTKRIDLNFSVDIIIHAASQASPKFYVTDPVGTINANVIGSYNLLEFAKEKGVKDFIYISSSEVYGQKNVEFITEEDYGYIDLTNIRSCYSEGKRGGEALCVAYSHQYGINAKIVRLFHTYGPGMPLDDGRVFADFAKNIILRQNIVMKSEGKNVRAFLYVADMIDGILRILMFGEKANAYNVANPKQSCSILELASRLVSCFQDRGIKLIQEFRQSGSEYLETPNKTSMPFIDKLKKLGFEPDITIEEGFQRVVEYYELTDNHE